MQQRHTFRLSEQNQIVSVAFGTPNATETIFASLSDQTVRSFAFSQTANELIQIAQMQMNDPDRLLWEPLRGQLLVADFDRNQKAQNVRALCVTADGQLALLGTPITTDMQIWIWSWCRIGANAIACFDGKKREIVLFDIK